MHEEEAGVSGQVQGVVRVVQPHQLQPGTEVRLLRPVKLQPDFVEEWELCRDRGSGKANEEIVVPPRAGLHERCDWNIGDRGIFPANC